MTTSSGYSSLIRVWSPGDVVMFNAQRHKSAFTKDSVLDIPSNYHQYYYKYYRQLQYYSSGRTVTTKIITTTLSPLLLFRPLKSIFPAL